MAEIYEFKNNSNENEECTCEYCQLAEEFVSIVAETETPQELFNVLRELISEATRLGIVEFLEKENENNVKLVHSLKYGFDEE
jgi:hypothetical protein